MADDNGDLISNVGITGIEETSSNFKKLGDEGAAAFDKIAAAAKSTSDTVASASDNIVKEVGGIQKALPNDEVPTRIEKIGDAVLTLKQSITSSVGSLTTFATKIEAIGAASIAGIFGIAKFAASVTKSFRDLSEAQSSNIRETQAQGKSQVEAIRAANSYGNEIEKLQEELRKGKITYGDYGNAVTKLNKEFDRQAAAQARVMAAQEEAQKRNDAVRRTQAENAAYQKLVATYGGPLTASLVALGKTYDSVHKQVVEAFSPAVAKLVDAIGNVIDKNRGAITKFIDDGSAALDKFIKQNGPQVEAFFHTMADVIKGVGKIVVSVVIPAFALLMTAAKTIAELINNIFGTKLTAGTLIAAAAIVFFTGAIGTAVTVVSAIITALSALVVIFTPVGLLIAAVTVALVIFAASVNWSKLGNDIQNAFRAVMTFFASLPKKITDFFSTLWESVKQLASDAADAIISAFTAVVDYFSTFPDNLLAIFQTLWETLVAAAQAAGSAIVQGWTAVMAFFSSMATAVGQFFADLWTTIQQLASAAAQFVVDGWTAVVSFFSNLPTQVGQFFVDLWNNVKARTAETFEALKKTVKSWVDSVLEFLKPVLDAIKAAKDFFSLGPDGSNSTPAQGFAGGGEVRGPGTSISDSIAAWLSNNEFVMRAKAVAKYGLGFMHAINEGRLDLSRILGFAAGGLVQSLQGNQAPRLAFASGGQATTHASRVLNLSIGGEHFNGLIMPDEVANKLTKYAVGRQTQSAGRKPAWVGGRT